jgi:ATP-dependent helicase HrpB
LSNGRGAVLPPTDPLAAADFLAIADLDGDKREARIFLAAPLTLAEIEAEFAGQLERRDTVAWDAREGAVLARRQLRFGELVLREERLADPPQDAVLAALLSGIRQVGLSALPWSREVVNWRARVSFLRAAEGAAAGWPDLSDAALLASLEDWLAPALDGVTRLSQLGRVDLASALRNRLDWERQHDLDRLAPSHWTVPSGSRLPIDYTDGEPTLAVRLQEMFGTGTTPAVAGGKVRLRLQLLSPAGRPLQVTSDLEGFWANSYRAVRSDMRGRYPKHPWPEDPLNAEPTSRAKRRAS